MLLLLLRREDGLDARLSKSCAVVVYANETEDEEPCGSRSSLPSESLAAVAAMRFRRRLADCLTFATHLAEALAHRRCWVRARFSSSLSSMLSPPKTDGVPSVSFSARACRFCRHRTMPIMNTVSATASDSERPRIMPVMSSSTLPLSQPGGREGDEDAEEVAVTDPDDVGVT